MASGSNSSRPTSPSQSGPRSSRQSSISTPGQAHRPQVPSGLRQAHMPPPSPEDTRIHYLADNRSEVEDHGIMPAAQESAGPETEISAAQAHGDIDEPQPDALGKLREQEQKYTMPKDHDCGEEYCGHGAFSPRPRHVRGRCGSFATYGTMESDGSRDGFGGPYREVPQEQERQQFDYRGDYIDRALGDAVTDGLLGHPGKSNTTHWLAKRHGVKNERLMYAKSLSIVHAQHLRATNTELQDVWLIISLGSSSTTFPLPIGSGNINGPICAGISLRRSPWPHSTSLSPSHMPPTSVTFPRSTACTPSSSTRSSTPSLALVRKWSSALKRPALYSQAAW